MATRPTICPPSPPDGFLFVRSELDLQLSGDLFEMLDLSDFYLDVSSFSKVRYKLGPSDAFLLSQVDIGDDDGYVRFIVFKVVFPENTTTTNKYINWTYKGSQHPMGELMILSGDRINLIGGSPLGWKLSSSNPLFTDGGIMIQNPHTSFGVTVEILVAR